MKLSIIVFSCAAVLLVTVGCETSSTTGDSGGAEVPAFTNAPAAAGAGESNPFEGKQIPGGVEIYELGTKITTLKSSLPNVEAWKFVSGGTQVVVKSRASHGPAAVELFDVAGGVLKEKVMAFDIKDGKPEWAAAYAE